jgi:hypothetical protein
MGRKRIEILLPNGPFTTRTLEEQYPHVSDTVIHKRIQEWLKLGKVKCVGKRQQENVQQKAWYLYEPVRISNAKIAPAARATGRNRTPRVLKGGGKVDA